MNYIWKTFFSLSFSGSLLILVLFIGKHFFKNKLSRQWQYYIWIIAIMRLLVPFAPKTNLMGNLFQTIDFAVISLDMVETVQTLPEDKSNLQTIHNIKQKEQENIQEKKGLLDNQTIRDQVTVLLNNVWLIWLVIAFVLFIRKITIYESFMRYVKSGQIPVSDIKLLDHLAMIQEQLKIKKNMELCVNPLMISPLLIGFFSPCIVLPSIDISEKEFHYIVLHELMHYQRRDMFYKWLVQITICLHWFNPLVHIMGHEINKACEFSCDETIIARLNFNQTQEYGRTLLNAMAMVGTYKEVIGSVTLSENKELLKERLQAIMSFKKKTRLVKVISIVLIFVLCFGSTVSGAYVTSPTANLKKKQSAISLDTKTMNGKLQPTDFAIECTSEKIIVKQGGTKFKVEVDSKSEDSYTIRNNTNIPYKERYYRFNKWDIIVEKEKNLTPSAVLSSAITLTIPSNIDEPALYLHTLSGNIYVEGLEHVKLAAESRSGNISVKDTAAKYISAASYDGNINLTDVTSTDNIEVYSAKGLVTAKLGISSSQYAIKIDTESDADITINKQHYNGGTYTIGDNKKQIFTLKGLSNTFQVSNISFSKNKETKVLKKNKHKQQTQEESYWTEKEFLSFMKIQKQKYKELLSNGNITKEEFNTYISTDKETLKEIQRGIEVPKASTGNIENGIGT